MIVRRFKINMIPGGKMAEVALSQYDSNVTLEFELYASDGTFVVESGTTAVFRGSKPDKNGISVAAELESIIDPETGKNIYLATVDVIPQMTAVAGRSLYELSLQKGGEELNTANFILDIERAPLDADTLPSESVIRELVDVIDKADEIIAAAEAVTTAIDDTLTQQGKAADAKKVGDEINDIKADLGDLANLETEDKSSLVEAINEAAQSGLSDDAKSALLACFEHVAWIDDNGQDYYDDLEAALNPRVLSSISAVFTQGQHVVYTGDSLDSLKQYLVVIAHYADQTTATVLGYTLSGTLTVGTSIITVTYEDKTTTFNVTVTASPYIYDYSASSGVNPPGMTGYSFDFNDESGAVKVNQPDFTLNHENEFEFEIVCKFALLEGASNPYMSINYATGDGTKSIQIRPNNSTEIQAQKDKISYALNWDSSTKQYTNYSQTVYRKYKILVEDGLFKFYIDDTLITQQPYTGSNPTGTNTIRIVSAEQAYNRYNMHIKSIRLRNISSN